MIPVTVIGGYLGAGKTTLVNHLIRHADGRRLAILVNDFGDLAIDADLIEARDDDMIAIAGGCVCCSFGSDLMAALGKLSARAPAPDHVLIETSGVALPDVVARSVALVPGFARAGVVVLADAETVTERAADRYLSDTIDRQLADADLVILNKTDLISAERLVELHAWLTAKAPQARSIEAVRGAVPFEVVCDLPNAEGATRFDTGASGSRDSASETYETCLFHIPAAVGPEALARALTAPETGVIRAKGFVTARDGSVHTIQITGARFETARATTAVATPHAIVCIGVKGRIAPAAIAAAIRGSEAS